jgi:hypothetical protein
MLPEPSLDNQTYKDIVDSAQKSIARIMPLWTDHNAHDPGMTLVELFAWLKEMQQYHLDQIPESGRMKFLKLLGVQPKDVESALAYMVFSQGDQDIRLPAGAKLSSHHLIFETAESHTLPQARISKLISVHGQKTLDLMPLLQDQDQDLAWPVFGDPPESGACLYIGFHWPLPVHTRLSLFFESSYPRGVRRNPVTDADLFIPLSTLSWEYLDFHHQYTPLNIRRDETYGLIQSGRLLFQLPGRMAPDADGVYWIRCRLIEPFFDIPPYLTRVRNNMLPVIQQNTLVTHRTVPLKQTLPSNLTLNHWMAVYGRSHIQIQDQQGRWLGPLSCALTQDALKQRLSITIDAGRSPLSPEQIYGLRVISCLPEYESACRPGHSTGLPLQTFPLAAASVKKDGFRLQIGYPLDSHHFAFEDWEQVQDWDASSPLSRHYLLDSAGGYVSFGDGIRGLIPPKGALIQIISLATCQGKEGNVKNGEINRLVKSQPLSKPLQAYNPAHAFGGRDPESLEESFLRFHQDMLRPDRAVTLADYEALAWETPGLALRKIKLIPSYRPGLSGYPENKAKNHVTLVVAPFSAAIASNVLQYLNRRRLITTQIHVLAPEYLPLDIYAEIRVKPYDPSAVLHIENALKHFLDPMEGGSQGHGWQFGQGVGYEEVYRFMDALEWVDHIYSLNLNCRGNGVVQTTRGDLRIPPYALVHLRQCVLDTAGPGGIFP